MSIPRRIGPALAAALLIVPAVAQLQPTKMVAIRAPQSPSQMAAQADAVVVGKVAEVEKDTVEASPYKGAPKDANVSFRIAVIKVDEALLGAGGVTRLRVGFPADAPPPAGTGVDNPPPLPPGVGGRIRRPGAPVVVALTEGMEGCFCLTRHPDGDFYMLAGSPLQKKDDSFVKEVDQVKKVAKAINDPVAALKAKDLEDRFQAAQVILQRYQRNPNPAAPAAREPIPEDENKLIVALLKELPWMPDQTRPRGQADPVPPNRNSLWYLINPQELGFKQPTFQPQKPGDPPVDFNKVMDEATSKFLKENGDKIRIKRFAEK